MKNCIISLSSLLVLLHFTTAAFGLGNPVAVPTDVTTQPAANPTINDFSCPPPSNIKVEMLLGGKALISWDAIPGVPKYKVILEDENLNILLDTLVPGNKVLVTGLVAGRKYKVEVCYLCLESGKMVCHYKSFRYVIIDEQVVMYDGKGACDCKTLAETEGICNSSMSPYFSLETPRIYNVHLIDDTDLSILCENTINPVGNCHSNFGTLGYAVHGDFGSQLPYYEIGASKIFFHGSTFCVQGAGIESVTFCDINNAHHRSENVATDSQVSPNPFSDRLMVEIEKSASSGSTTDIQLLNASGALVFQESTTAYGAYIIQTAQIPPGLYWLCLRREGRILNTRRLLKLE